MRLFNRLGHSKFQVAVMRYIINDNLSIVSFIEVLERERERDKPGRIKTPFTRNQTVYNIVMLATDNIFLFQDVQSIVIFIDELKKPNFLVLPRH
jgi:hypothetical protein